jgi:hypothetical protein
LTLMCKMDECDRVVLLSTHSKNYKFLRGILETNTTIEKEDP